MSENHSKFGSEELAFHCGGFAALTAAVKCIQDLYPQTPEIRSAIDGLLAAANVHNQKARIELDRLKLAQTEADLLIARANRR